jgi:hypothetical protein
MRLFHTFFTFVLCFLSDLFSQIVLITLSSVAIAMDFPFDASARGANVRTGELGNCAPSDPLPLPLLLFPYPRLRSDLLVLQPRWL